MKALGGDDRRDGGDDVCGASTVTGGRYLATYDKLAWRRVMNIVGGRHKCPANHRRKYQSSGGDKERRYSDVINMKGGSFVMEVFYHMVAAFGAAGARSGDGEYS